MRPTLGVVCAVWLVVGGFAGQQRDNFSHGLTCDAAATSVVTAAAGPLNYYGISPEIECPEPS